ncbi:MAG TPA: outer membrane protein assembly factor BamC [Burkholderiaceae bacterium]|nr:outer membrane protein assembly factor BamC [Burkholderiaceae bacterium]HMX10430.1 outer membrane protein assembly factor BamC [Burkholderiaceae bacterium]HNB42638.1 outer membrane protein assembly factor BamC [Burkholderiaceae bacterium]HNG79431.1 outer membrane protein assembly factor BamC [Burkholderiaceae bacterium]
MRRPHVRGRLALACAAACRWSTVAVSGAALMACSSVSDTLSPSKVDYRSSATNKAPTLDVPPDLTQLSSDPRYAPPAGAAVSANALQAAPNASVPSAIGPNQTVAAQSAGELRIERAGNTRWLVSRQTPEQLWPLLREFWQQSGFALIVDRPEVGVMETDWAENRARLPQDFIRRSMGKVFDMLSDTGERDRFRTRIERGANGGTEIYISHRGAVEVLVGDQKETSRWTPRASEPDLEVEMLGRLMLKLGAREETKPSAQAAAAAAQTIASVPAAAARARVLDGRAAATLQIDDNFDRTWRRVGLALDRGGFTLEDRDRSQGLYFVRYVDPKLAGKEEPNFFQRMFGAKKEDLSGKRYRLKVSTQDKASLLEVLDTDGKPLADESARSMVQLLLPELR